MPCVSVGGFLLLWPSRGGGGGGWRDREEGATTIYPDNQPQCLPPLRPTHTLLPCPINYACFYYPSSSSSGTGQWPANSYSLMCVFTVIMTHNTWTIDTSVCTKKTKKKLNSPSSTTSPPPKCQLEKAVHVWALRL